MTLNPETLQICGMPSVNLPSSSRGWSANNRKKGGSCAYHFTGCVFWTSCPSRNHQNILASQSWLPMWLPSLPLPLSPRQLLSLWLSVVSWVLIAEKRNQRRISNPLPFPLTFRAWGCHFMDCNLFTFIACTLQPLVAACVSSGCCAWHPCPRRHPALLQHLWTHAKQKRLGTI